MFSSYTSSRSKSTTDIFRASSADLDDASYPPAVSYTTRFRKNPNSAGVVNSRRRRIAAAPVPPQRSNSSFADNLDHEASALKRVRSHLTDDDVLRRREPDPSNVTMLPTQLTRSPGSKNFVKKLVATLERRQRERQLGIVQRFDLQPAVSSEITHKKNARNTVPAGTRMQEISRDQGYMATRFNSEQVVSRLPASQLEDLHERDEDADEDEDEDEDWYDSADLPPQFWEHDVDEEAHHHRPSPAITLPIHIIERRSEAGNSNDDNPSKSSTVKRTIKNMLSSMLNWKNSKGLPKGSREYYAARESLGEEMRAFRRDTMPRLMEHATIKGKLNRKRITAATAAAVQGVCSDDQREFSELIGSPKENNNPIAAEQQPSIATIHRVYGSSCSSHQRRSWHKQDFSVIDENKREDKEEVVYGSCIKVQPPTPPPRASSQLLLSPAPPDLQLLRPSKVRDLQQRISRESYSQVQLRRPLQPVANNDNNNNNNNNKRGSIVYDVPQSNRRVESSEDTVLVRSTPPEYENVSGIIGAHDDDKRLHCTAFTTF